MRKINGLSLFGCVMFFSMMCADLYSWYNFPVIGYADEIHAAIAWMGVIFYLFRVSKMSKSSSGMLLALSFWILIGWIGNMNSGLVSSIQPMITDAFMFSKPYIIYLFWSIYSKKNTTLIIDFVSIVSRFMLAVLCFFAIVSRVLHIGMITWSGSFTFLSSYYGFVSWWTVLFLSALWLTKTNEKTFILYMIMSGVVILMNRSGLGLVVYGLAIMLYIMMERKQKIRWYYIVIAALLCIYLGWNDIADYLLNSTSPRALFLKYAFITANKYFPLGSGFATYGSSAAIRQYSKLYYLYRFNRRGGMTPDYHPYLMDNYYQQIIGQLGYFGAAVLLIVIYRVYRRILHVKKAEVRSSLLVLYSCWALGGIAFGIASSWGCAVYMLLPLFLKQDSNPPHGRKT